MGEMGWCCKGYDIAGLVKGSFFFVLYRRVWNEKMGGGGGSWIKKKPMAPMCVTILPSIHDAFYVRGGSEGYEEEG